MSGNFETFGQPNPISDQEKAEQKERFGENITMRVHYFRHAEKTEAEGPLSEQGKQDAADYAAQFESLKDGSKIYHSPLERAAQTAQAMEGQLEGGVFQTRRKKELLAMQPGEPPPFSQEFIEKYDALSAQHSGNEDAALEWYLAFGSERPDPFSLAPKEVAARIAQTILHSIEMSSHLKNDSETDSINISHSGILEPFLQEIFQSEFANNSGETFIQKIGGGLHYLQGFEVVIHRQNKAEVALTISFRGKTKDISVADLETMSTFSHHA